MIDRLLEAVSPAGICEIGVETGATTVRLLEWMAAHECQLWCIDPDPPLSIERAGTEPGRATVIRGRSPAALTQVDPPVAFWIIDGDHNYWTVSAELQVIHDRHLDQLAEGGVILLHDVGWPWGRRDQYCEPGALPSAAVHPHSWGLGVRPGDPGLAAAGFRGEGAFAVATREGGPRNGVLTAVEDFLERHSGTYEYVKAPLVFGLGIIWTKRHPKRDTIRRLCDPFSTSVLLERAEANRLALYLAVLERDQELRGQFVKSENDRLRHEEEQARLRMAWQGRRAQDVLIGRELHSLLDSYWIKLLEFLERPLRRRRPGLGSVKERISRVADAVDQAGTSDPGASVIHTTDNWGRLP